MAVKDCETTSVMESAFSFRIWQRQTFTMKDCFGRLTLIWVGFLGVRFEVVEGGGVKLPPIQNLFELC